MSLFLEMLRAAKEAPALLGESTGLIHSFIVRQQNPDGGFKNRAGHSDLYYTVFGLAGLAALEPSQMPDCTPDGLFWQAAAKAERFLGGFGAGETLDFVHLCCLGRAWAILSICGIALESRTRLKLVERIESYRSADGGYHPAGNSDCGTVYGAFLAMGTYQDLGLELPNPLMVATSVDSMAVGDGSWTNDGTAFKSILRGAGSTNATAAAIAVLQSLGKPPGDEAAHWLLARLHRKGGFLAAPTSPIPDLLSTATALHALASMRRSFEAVREQCLDFIDSLWTAEGGFYGHWGDDHLDTEYTFYGLLALGHLGTLSQHS